MEKGSQMGVDFWEGADGRRDIQKIMKFFKKTFAKPLDKFKEIVYNLYRCRETACESGGTGRRARLRGVWFTPYGFKSRFSHHN